MTPFIFVRHGEPDYPSAGDWNRPDSLAFAEPVDQK